MHFLPNKIEQYINDHSENEPYLLAELRRETHLKVINPRMLTGHYQGRVLSLFSKMKNPKNILEIGTYTGYSAICLAEGMQKDGVLQTIDINEELAEMQRSYFDKSGFGHQIIQHLGNALEIIPTLDTTFDLVFIDAEKKEYDRYFEAALPKCATGSLIISDNVLWSGKVTEPLKPSDRATKALMAYNKKLKEDTRVETVLLPLRDGLTLSRVL